MHLFPDQYLLMVFSIVIFTFFLNLQIVKHEWPHNWPSFIPDLCSAARTNQVICENSMRILSLLSEEVFDFGRDYMTSQKVHVLMSSLNDQFQQIYDLCMFVILNSVVSGTPVSPSLLTATLQCLSHFVKWIPYSYMFETKLIDMLLQYFWEPTQHRVDCVRYARLPTLRVVKLPTLHNSFTALFRSMKFSAIPYCAATVVVRIDSLVTSFQDNFTHSFFFF